MAKDRRKVQHIHSSVPDKQPTPASLEVGEIAVNNSKDQEFLSIKNSEDKVVRFSSDEQVITIMERKEVMPYEGLVRGAEGPGGSKDSYNSYGITEGDLKTNKSNLIIKLNQVAAGNTTKHNKVNGAKDIYNNLVNPTTDGGLNDGAGFAIDMSRYAMNGANPSFSSVTTTCHTELNGRTEILGGNGTTGDCRSYLKIDVLTADTKVGSAKTGISTATTVIGTNDTTISGNTTLKVSGTTTENHLQNVTINNSQNYSILTSGNTVIHSNGAVGISAKEDITAVSTENNVYITANKNLCASAGDNATFYGEDVTNIGTNCNGTGASTNTNINGVTITNSATTINNSATTINNTATTYNVTATSHFNGDVYIDNSKKLYLTPDCTTELTSTTVNAALCEVLNRGVITIEENHNPSDTNLAAVYTFYQNGKKVTNSAGTVVEIEVAKDKVLKSAAVVQNTSGEWVIRLTWITYDPDTGQSTETTTDVPASELVKDLDFVTTDSIKGSIWYDSTSGNQKISADTTVQIVTDGNGTKTFSKNNAVHSLNSYKLNVTHNGLVNAEFDPFKESTSLTFPHSSLTATYEATSGKSGSVKFDTAADKSISIPTAVNHLNRGKLTLQKNSTTIDTFDPASDKTINITVPTSTDDITNNLKYLKWSLGTPSTDTTGYNGSSEKTITIPSSIDHLDEWNGTCFTIPHNLCVDGTITAGGSIYSTSDERKKQDIQHIALDDKLKVRNIPLKSFAFKDDPQRKVYGVIAQEVEAAGLNELVHTDEGGMLSVDYTSFLILRVAYLEKLLGHMHTKIAQLEEKINKK